MDAAAVGPLGGVRAVASAALPSGSGEAATSAAGFGTSAVVAVVRPPPFRPPILDKEGRRAKGRVKAVLEGGYAGRGDGGGGGGQMRTSDARGGRREDGER